MMNKITLTSLTVLSLSSVPLLWVNSAEAQTKIGGINISGFNVADDVPISQSAKLTDFKLWAFGQNQNTQLGQIGWRIYTSNPNGTVGSLVASGTNTPAQTGTGFISVLDTPVVQLDGTFASPVAVAPGNYYVSFVGQGSDNGTPTAAFWATTQQTGGTIRYDTGTQPPTYTSTLDNTAALFELFGDITPAETTPEPSTLLGLLAVSSLGVLSRQKKAKK